MSDQNQRPRLEWTGLPEWIEPDGLRATVDNVLGAGVETVAVELLPATGGGEFATVVYRLSPAPSGPSLIVKVARRNDATPASGYNHWLREPCFYHSPRADRLPSGMRAPTCAAVAVHDGGSVLVLEDVGADDRSERSIGWYEKLARLLGQLNGPEVAEADAEWFSHDFAAAEVASIGAAVDRLQASPVGELSARLFTGDVRAGLLSTHARRHQLVAAIDQLPLGFSHLDAFSRNVVEDDGGAVALFDWSNAGLAPLGVELAGLFWLTVAFLDHPTQDLADLDDALFEAYRSGLGDTGRRVDVDELRVAFAAATALRHLATLVNAYPMIEEEHPAVSAVVGRPLPEVIDTWVAATPYVQELAHWAVDRLPSG